MRFQMPLAIWASLLCLLWNGCTQLAQESRPNPVAGTRSKPSQSVRVARRRPTPRSVPATSPSRTGSSEVLQADLGRARIEPPASQRDGVQQAGGLLPARTRSASPPPPTPLDPAAAAVIEQELADTEPAERQGILNDLEGLSPNNMRAVLRAWKQSRQRRMPGETLTAGPPAPAAGESESTTSRLRRSLSAGLGTVSAWGTAIVSGRRGEPLAAPGIEIEAAGTPAPAPPTPRGQIEAISPPVVESHPLPGGASSRPVRSDEEPKSSSNPLQELIDLTEAEVAELPSGPGQVEQDEFISRHVALRMLYLVGGRHELALQSIPEIDPIEQEFWQHLFWGLANYFDTESLPGNDERAAEAAAQLTQAVLKLQRRATLEIKFASLCDQVEGYGVFEPRTAPSVAPGEAVLLYAELANVSSVEDGSGQHLASHANLIELLPQGGETDQVIAIELPVTEDRCRRQRRDYFASYAFEMPQGLSTGPHVLRLTVTDQSNRRRAQYSVNFLVGDSASTPGPAALQSAPEVSREARRRSILSAGPTESSGQRVPVRNLSTGSVLPEPVDNPEIDAAEEPSLPRAMMSAKAPDREEEDFPEPPVDAPLDNLETRANAEAQTVEPSSFESELMDDEELSIPDEPPTDATTPQPVHLPDFVEVEAEDASEAPAQPEDAEDIDPASSDSPAEPTESAQPADDEMPPLPPI